MGDNLHLKSVKKPMDSNDESQGGEYNAGYEHDEWKEININTCTADNFPDLRPVTNNNNGESKICSNNVIPTSEIRSVPNSWATTIENYINERRRSSIDVIRRNRTFKRFSRAFSSVSLFYQEIIEYQLIGISELEVLNKLFEIFDYHHEQKLNQIEWIELLKSRLSQCGNDGVNSPFQLEDKQVDFVEVVESVAYAVCGDKDVTFQQFCEIFRTKNVLNKFFRLIDRDLDGAVTGEEVMEFISQFGTARSGSRLTKDNIQWLEKLFRQYVGDEKEIKKEDFSKIIQTKNQFFTDRVFDIFDGDASGSISLQEFLLAINKFASENPEDKIRFLFKVYDVDGDGLIQEAELEQVMRACMEENGMKFSDEQIHELTTALFEDADVEGRGALTYDALKAQLEKHTGLLENLSISIERWLVPPKPTKPVQFSIVGKMRSMKPHQFSIRYFKNNYVYLVWFLAFLITNAALFISRALSFHKEDPTATSYLVFARAAGQCLNFNCTFIVVVMLRRSLTYLRSRRASAYLPIDQHINFHKMTGRFIFMFGLLHSVTHLFNIDPGVLQNNTGNFTYLEVLFEPKATQTLGLVPGCAFNSGIILLIILIIMVLCSLPCVRRGGCFEVFYWTHLLYAPFWILLIIHAPNFWKWFIVPGIIFIIEQALRYYHWRVGRGKTHISSGLLLPSKVTHLIIARPPNFEYNPGDYVFVRIPKIAKYEWHPFTISSGPEQDDAIWLHIRAVGQWTNRLYEYFEEQSKLIEIDTPLEFRPRYNAYSRFSSQKRIRYPAERPLEIISNEKVNPLNVDPNKRSQLKSVADSITTLIPESELSSSNASCNDIASSVDELNEQAAILTTKKNPTLLKKTPLTATKSMPDVFERVTERERKLYLREFGRSESVRTTEDIPPDNRSRSSSNVFPKNGKDRSAVLSVRYMRNKPQIIELKAPNSEDEKTVREKLLVQRSISSNDRLAEEGRSRFVSIKLPKGNQREVSIPENDEPSFYELGTTMVSRELSIGHSLEIYVDGPYGAPSSHIFRAQHAVLIATGIGVTPFASILQSIMRRYWASRNTCPKCTYTWCSELPQSVLNLQKVDFFWINRDQRSFEWFVHLLSQLEIEQAELGGAMERFLDMHMYITSALQRTDMKAVGLQLALDLLHEKEKRDLITGLKTRTNAGRPNWNKIFNQLKDQHKGKVTVFYCGPPALARTLKIKCDEFNFSFRKELF